MGNKKIFEFLNLLSVLVRTGEINLTPRPPALASVR